LAVVAAAAARLYFRDRDAGIATTSAYTSPYAHFDEAVITRELWTAG
jgi:hypothetical protein